MSLSSLPLEVIVKIFSFLQPEDIARASGACKIFHHASGVSKLWEHLCQRDYIQNLKQEDTGHLSYQDFYTKVLHPYGFLLGLWKMKIKDYRGLATIKVSGGEIIATELVPAVTESEVWQPLRRKGLFRIHVGPGGVYLDCIKGTLRPHPLILEKKDDFKGWPEFWLKCDPPGTDHPHASSMEEGIRDAIGSEHQVDPGRMELLIRKYECLLHYECYCTFSALQPASQLPSVPIQPGFFKGTYGGHGVEIIQLAYKGNRLQGTKITGDPNVPAGEMSIEVHLDERIVLTRDQQRSLADLQNLDKESHILREGQESPEQQPFSVPWGVFDRGFEGLCREKDIPMDFCRERYLATGLIAYPGFRGISRIDAHFILFSEDVFAFLWMKLSSLSVFCRAEDIS